MAGGAGLLLTSCRVVNRRRFSPCYPSAPASGHKWICWLTFQGSEQQMIPSSKAKDKETKAPGFLLRKHREQALCWRTNSAGGHTANSITSTVCFSGRGRRCLIGTVTILRKSLRCNCGSGGRESRRRVAAPIWKIMVLQMKMQEGAKKKKTASLLLPELSLG